MDTTTLIRVIACVLTVVLLGVIIQRRRSKAN